MESIHPFIHRKVVIMNQDRPAFDAARAMRDNRIGCVLLTDERGRIVGIVTDRDFASRLAADYPATDVALSEIMSQNVVMAKPDVTLANVIHLMEAHGVRRIPIVEPAAGGGQRCVGIVTLDDLIASQFIEPGQLARIVQRQIGRRVLTPLARAGGARAELRSEARSEQTLHQFYDKIARESGLTADKVPQVANYLLGSLAMRLSPIGAAHFAAQLPKFIREFVSMLPPGPDRGITADKLRTELVARFNYAEDYARELLHKFFAGLGMILGQGELNHIKAQLPADLSALFSRELAADERRRVLIPLTSESFNDGEEIPRRFTGDGEDRNPSLEWSDVPPRTKEFALICEDPDASGGVPFVHWVIYGISAETTMIPEGLPKVAALDIPIRAIQGRSSAGTYGYEGPMPPKGHGWHHYCFKLFALDHEVSLHPGASRDELMARMRGHVLAEAVLVGRYKREAKKRVA